MSPEQRFERIESSLLALVEMQTRTQATIQDLATTVSEFVDMSKAKAQEVDARMARIEANLDGLIRAIMAEHSNGKAKQ